MILRSLSLENIRSYLHEKIEFPEGSVLLSGDIGCGKSTILYGIEFALFGIMRAEISGTSLLRHGKNHGSVELEFSIDKDDYVIKRTLKRAKTGVVQDIGYLITNGRKFEATPIELKARILEILGYPEEMVTKGRSLLYRYTVYTPQEEMKQILFEDKDLRLDTLRRLFGIDKYRSIKENSVIFLRELRKKKSEYEIKIENYSQLFDEHQVKLERSKQLIDVLEKSGRSLKDLTDKIKNHKLKLKKLEEKLEKNREIKKDYEIKLAILASVVERKHELPVQIQKIETNIGILQSKLKEFEEIKELKSEKELETKLNEFHEQLEKAIKKNTLQAEQLHNINTQIKEKEREIKILTESSTHTIILKSELNDLEQKLNKKKQQIELKDNNVEQLRIYEIKIEKGKLQIKTSQEIIDKIKTADICPTCSQKLDKVHRDKILAKESRLISEYTEILSNIQKKIDKVNNNLNILTKNLKVLETLQIRFNEKREKFVLLNAQADALVEKQKQISVLYQRLKELQSQETTNIENIQTAISDTKTRLAEIRNHNIKYREKKNILDNIQKDRELAQNLENEIKAIEDKIQRLKSEIENIKNTIDPTVQETFDKNMAETEALLEDQKTVEIIIAEHKKELQNLDEQVQKLDKQLLDMSAIKTRIKYIEDVINWFDKFFLDLVVTIEKHVMYNIHNEFSQFLREWFNMLIEGLEISLDEEFKPTVIQDGYETDIESLSGGEKTSAALAYRLALNRVINDLVPSIKTKELIILDEPTDGFSSEQLDKVRDVLEQLNSRQTIIVSHEPKMESYVQNIVRIVKSDNTSHIIS